MNRTAGFLLHRLEQATGVSALAEISDFFTSMSGLFENFHERVERAYEVLRGAETAFVLVSGPEEQVLGDAEYLAAKMAELRMPLKGVVMNRVHAEFAAAAAAATHRAGPEDVERCARLVARARRRAERRAARWSRTSPTTRRWRAASRSASSSSARASRSGVPLVRRAELPARRARPGDAGGDAPASVRVRARRRRGRAHGAPADCAHVGRPRRKHPPWGTPSVMSSQSSQSL